MARIAQDRLEGSLAGILATRPASEARAERSRLAEEARAHAAPTLARMGIILDELELVRVQGPR